jgi:hypothetical protein
MVGLVGIVAANLLDEALGVLAAHENLDGLAERRGGGERVVHDGIDVHAQRPLRITSGLVWVLRASTSTGARGGQHMPIWAWILIILLIVLLLGGFGYSRR